MTETKVQYQTMTDVITDADRWNQLGERAQLLYLLALRHINERGEIQIVDHRALGELISYGGKYSDWNIVDAVREWWAAGLVVVPDEDADGQRRIVFREHELMGGHCVWMYDEYRDCWTTSCGDDASVNDDVEFDDNAIGSPASDKFRFCIFCGRMIQVGGGELVEVAGVAI